mgnify:CR=1 FL=1
MSRLSLLCDVPTGPWFRITRVLGGQGRLESLGFLPLEPVRLLRRSPFKKGAMVVQVGAAVFALRPAEAAHIGVEALS